MVDVLPGPGATDATRQALLITRPAGRLIILREACMANRTRSHGDNGVAVKAPRGVTSGDETLSPDRCREVHRIMCRARALEERMIKMSKSGEGYFWIG